MTHTDPKKSDRFQLGFIGATHGLKGEVKLYPTTGYPERIGGLGRVFIRTPRGQELETSVERARESGKFVITKFKGIDSIEEAQAYRDSEVMVAREDAAPLEEGEYYQDDLIGLTVLDEADGRVLGRITGVIETGANDVYEMEREDGQGAVLLPAVRECIREIDIDSAVMRVHVLEGLM